MFLGLECIFLKTEIGDTRNHKNEGPIIIDINSGNLKCMTTPYKINLVIMASVEHVEVFIPPKLTLNKLGLSCVKLRSSQG